jgi:hypothetical protein
MSNGNDALMAASGTPWAKWPTKGDVVTGTVVEGPTLRQSRDYDTGLPATFPSGDPKMEIVVIIQTAERSADYEDDDGRRQVVMKRNKNLHSAVRAAVKASGAKGLEEGGALAITLTDVQQKKNDKGMKYTENQYSATYRPPSAAKAPAGTDITEEQALDALSGLFAK